MKGGRYEVWSLLSLLVALATLQMGRETALPDHLKATFSRVNVVYVLNPGASAHSPHRRCTSTDQLPIDYLSAHKGLIRLA
jgi:hypothetical protein